VKSGRTSMMVIEGAVSAGVPLIHPTAAAADASRAVAKAAVEAPRTG
jgi:hypothetical protein